MSIRQGAQRYLGYLSLLGLLSYWVVIKNLSVGLNRLGEDGLILSQAESNLLMWRAIRLRTVET